MPRFRLIATLSVVLLSSAGCSEAKQHADFDYPTYRSVQAMNDNSDATVLGTVGELIGTELDNGGNPERGDEGQEQGTPLAMYGFTVERVLRGAAPQQINVAWLDVERLANSDQIRPLKPGQKVVLWLDHLSQEETPGLELVDDVWVPLSGDNGVMDVEGDRVMARSADLVAIDDEPGSAPLTTTLGQLAATK